MSVIAGICSDLTEATDELKSLTDKTALVDAIMLRLSAGIFASLGWESACECYEEMLVDLLDEQNDAELERFRPI